MICNIDVSDNIHDENEVIISLNVDEIDNTCYT